MKRPRVTVRKPAPDHDDTTVEFTFPNGDGGLMCFRVRKGVPVIEIYRIDDGILVDVHPDKVTHDSM